MLFFFSCGDLPEIKPTDWNTRLSFTNKPYTGDLFAAWENDITTYDIVGDSEAPNVAQTVDKSQRWKGSGAFPADNPVPVYYIFKAAQKVTVTIDWRYGQDDGIGFAYKKVGSTGASEAHEEQISIEKDAYLVMRISPSANSSGVKWELGFTVK
jgi:hypothetical protein